MKIDRMNKGNWGKVRAFFDLVTSEGFTIKGFKLIYNGRNGNFIDMKYGIDMIMELEGQIFLIQVIFIT